MSPTAKKNSSFKLSLTVQYASGARDLPSRAQLRRWIKAALQRDVNMTLRIVDEPEGHELNKKYRGKDYATNVLTFVYDDAQPRHGGVEPSDEATSHSTRPSKNAGQVAGYGAGGAAGRLLPQTAGFAITSDLASVIGSPSRMARSSISNAPARGRPTGTPLLRSDPFALSQPTPLAGDIVICAPVVEREAAAQHKVLLAHYAHLTLHAALHLQGYEHENDAAAAEMEALEIALMLKLRYPDPYRT